MRKEICRTGVQRAVRQKSLNGSPTNVMVERCFVKVSLDNTFHSFMFVGSVNRRVERSHDSDGETLSTKLSAPFRSMLENREYGVTNAQSRQMDSQWSHCYSQEQISRSIKSQMLSTHFTQQLKLLLEFCDFSICPPVRAEGNLQNGGSTRSKTEKFEWITN